jgi:peptidoglycan-N-acetylglucosamine deacetylase
MFDAAQRLVGAGDEIGIHDYSHESPVHMTPQQQNDVLDKSIELTERLSGKCPRGYVAPWWELSQVTADL